MIRFSCPRCKTVLQAPDGSAGKKCKCSCGQRLQIPAPPSQPLNKTALGKLENSVQSGAAPLPPVLGLPAAGGRYSPASSSDVDEVEEVIEPPPAPAFKARAQE